MRIECTIFAGDFYDVLVMKRSLVVIQASHVDIVVVRDLSGMEYGFQSNVSSSNRCRVKNDDIKVMR